MSPTATSLGEQGRASAAKKQGERTTVASVSRDTKDLLSWEGDPGANADDLAISRSSKESATGGGLQGAHNAQLGEPKHQNMLDT